LVNICG